jgi:hypothetical protein
LPSPGHASSLPRIARVEVTWTYYTQTVDVSAVPIIVSYRAVRKSREWMARIGRRHSEADAGGRHLEQHYERAEVDATRSRTAGTMQVRMRRVVRSAANLDRGRAVDTHIHEAHMRCLTCCPATGIR